MDKMTIYIGREPMTFIWCPPGTFTMGTRGSHYDRMVDSIKVSFTEGFWLLETTVTKAMCYALEKDVYGEDGRLPCTEIAYWDVLRFCDKLKLFDGREFCLPTEAQWEYACAAGTRSRIGGAKCVSDIGWHAHNTYRIKPVALKNPNRWGFYDMLGNVLEMCADDYQEFHNPERSTSVHKDFCRKQPLGHEGRSWCVAKGGAYSLSASRCEVSNRWRIPKSRGFEDVGFRLVMK